MQRETHRLYRGDDHTIALSVHGADGDPVNLAGLRADLHAAVAGETVLQLSTENHRIRAVQTADGLPVLLLEFTHEQTAAADWTAADYDLQMTDKQGRIRTILRGQIRLAGDITPAMPSAAMPSAAGRMPQADEPANPAAEWSACTHISVRIDDTQTVYLAAETSLNADLLAFYNLAKA